MEAIKRDMIAFDLTKEMFLKGDKWKERIHITHLITLVVKALL